MLINLSDVFSSEGKVFQTTADLMMDVFDNGMDRFKVIDKSPLAFNFTNVEVNRIKVTGTGRLVLEAKCDRCLERVEVPMELTFDKEVVPVLEDTKEEDKDELSFMEGYQFDVEAFVKTEVIVNWPMKILCKDDCKGVCPVCGKNLNVVTCGCDTFVPDPRMAVIQDIFNANKEV